ncbi:MerR family transcriptional regulator [Candidatus Babeliales bacterium]|nr:MerR family transcriptional regulator [Candidatus Babeliales bacterium]
MQNQKIRMNKRKFRIGELSKKLKVKKFVIRFWEKEFELKSSRSEGGQRFYSQKDLDTFATIKDLLYNKKFTISGAKNQLEFILHKNNTSQIKPATKFIEKFSSIKQKIKNTAENTTEKIPNKIYEKIKNLKENLIKFKIYLK